jgi:hypothetical protein
MLQEQPPQLPRARALAPPPPPVCLQQHGTRQLQAPQHWLQGALEGVPRALAQ